ncbi:MAG TPA: SIS domain-containing protein [Gaiellaceae bacterium]|nr:SIS domain-containing protein [Gaiellaceae bacterium]
MDLEARVGEILSASLAVQQRVLERQTREIAAIAEAVATTLQAGGTILLCGNGGSAADAQHLAAEFVVRLHPSFDRRSLPAIALAPDAPLLTAAANDLGFERVFERLVEALGHPGDLLVGLSTSGRSENVVRALAAARAAGLRTVGLLGGDGGRALAHCELALLIESDDPGRVQEAHIVAGHAVVECAEALLVEAGMLRR